MTPDATGASTDVCRKGSRAAGLERCSSTTGPSKAATASCSDHDVWLERAGVDHQRIGPAAGGVDRLDEVALVVRLQVLELQPVAAGRRLGPGDVGGQGVGPVDGRLPLPEQVEVGPRQEEDEAHVRAPMAARVATTSAVATPRTASTPSGPSSTNVRSCCAFLSRPMNVDELRRLGARREVGRQIEAADDPAVLGDPVLVDAPEPLRQQGGEEDPDGHRLAVAQVPVGVVGLARPLERVGQGVAVVEDHAAAALALVLGRRRPP